MHLTIFAPALDKILIKCQKWSLKFHRKLEIPKYTKKALMNEALLEQEAFSCWTKVTRINLK